MSNDFMIALGLLSLVAAFPVMLNVYTTGEVSKFGIFLIVVGIGLVGYPMYSQPGTYSLETMPAAIVRVVKAIFS
ncbi:MAG: hypothetical protein OEZ19_04825 [Paracoccaceae bacterium]|nr:hypothetical protein [Paracoccaceae bacterium]